MVIPRFDHIIGLQKIPTIRFHWAVKSPQLEEESLDILKMESETFLDKHYFNNNRVAMFHRDKDYGLLPGSTNLWVPVTNTWGANTIWIGGEKLEGRDAKPINLNYGQALLFDGANQWHGSIWNTSGVTRVSFDLRFITLADYKSLFLK